MTTMIRSGWRRLALTGALACAVGGPAAAQVFDREDYGPDDIVRITLPCTDGRVVVVSERARGDYPAECGPFGPVVEFGPPGEPEGAYDGIGAFLMPPGVPFDPALASGRAFARVVNPVRAEPGLIVLAADVVPAGTPFAFVVNPPTQEHSSGYAIMLYRPERLLPAGFRVAAFEDGLGSVFRADGAVEIEANAPLYPGRYEIQVRDHNGFVIDRRPLTVAAWFPEIRFIAPDETLLAEGEPRVIRLDGLPDLQAGSIVEFRLLQQNPRGGWMGGGFANPGILYAWTDDDPWAGLVNGGIEIRPTASGPYRLVAIQTGYPGAEQVELGEVTFDVAPAVSPFQVASIELPEIVVVTDPTAISGTAEIPGQGYLGPFRLAVHRLPADPGGFEPILSPAILAAEGLASWPVRAGETVAMPADLPPGDYALALYGRRALIDPEPVSLASARFTVLPSEGYELRLSATRVGIGEAFTVSAIAPPGIELDDYRYFIEVAHLGGWLEGCAVQMEQTVWSLAPQNAGRNTLALPGDNAFDGPPLLLPGPYEARLLFGGGPDGTFYYSYRGAGPLLLARQAFTVGPEVAETALGLPPEPTPDEPILITAAVPAETRNSGYSIQVQPAGELAASGVERIPGDALDFSFFDGGDDEVSVRLRPGDYEARITFDGGCFLDYCPEIIVNSEPMVVANPAYQGPSDRPPAAQFDDGDRYGLWDQAGGSCAVAAEPSVPELLFVGVGRPQAEIASLALHEAFQVLVRYPEPPREMPVSIAVTVGAAAYTLPLHATENPREFLSTAVVLAPER